MVEITSDPAREVKWFFRINRDNKRLFRFFNSGGSGFDFTGATVVVNFKQKEGSNTNFLQLTSGSGLTITDNEILAVVTKAQAALFRDQTYFYEWVITTASYERNWIAGDGIFHNGKFDGVGSGSSDFTIYDGVNVVSVTVADSGGSLIGVPKKQGIWVTASFPTTSGVDEDGTPIKDGYYWLLGGSEILNIGGIDLPPGTIIWANQDDPDDEFSITGWKYF